MHFSRFNRSTNTGGGLALIGVISLLALYLIGTVEIGSFHAVLHNTVDDTELHSEANETNACHQNVYHNKKENCEHKSHVVANKKCSLCQLSMQSFHLFDNKPCSSFSNVSNLAIGENHTSYFGVISSLLPSRGPPFA